MYKSYVYQCPKCNKKSDFVTQFVNERCYCVYCSKDGEHIQMVQVKENDSKKVELLLEDDGR